MDQKYLHTMIRVRDLDASLRFFCEGLGLQETRRMDNEKGRYTLVFLAAAETPAGRDRADVQLAARGRLTAGGLRQRPQLRPPRIPRR